MNWLAHLLLSKGSPAVRIGGILPDLAKRDELKDLPNDFQRGIEIHYKIDKFTDSHKIVKQSIRHLDVPYQRFGGILVDMFYDHFLSQEWNYYSSDNLKDFAHSVYNSIDTYQLILPPSALKRLKQMREEDWLCSYKELEGIRLALKRINSRMKKPVGLELGINELESKYDLFHNDFLSFFPELLSFVNQTTKNQH